MGTGSCNISLLSLQLSIFNLPNPKFYSRVPFVRKELASTAPGCIMFWVLPPTQEIALFVLGLFSHVGDCLALE